MKPETRSFYEVAIQRAVERVVTQLGDAVDLATLAESACLSPFHFHRVFRGMVGETPMEFIRRLRLERAAWQLAHTEHPITRIAFDAGYETHEAFTRAFSAAYGTPPSGFRARKRQWIQLAARCGVHFDPAGGAPTFTPCDSGGRTMQVELKQLPGIRLGTVRHTGPYNQISIAFEKLGAVAGPAGLFRPEAQMIALYHDAPEVTPADQLRSDAAISVDEKTPLPAALVEQRLPAGEYACTTHIGPYEQLPDTWVRLMGEWIPSSGRRVADSPSYELYINNPMNTKPAELITELRVRLT